MRTKLSNLNNVCRLQIYDRVQVKDYSHSKDKWNFGGVVGKENSLNYRI